MAKSLRALTLSCCMLWLFHHASFAQFSGITGTGDGINYQYYGTITTALNEIRPFGIYATSIDVYIDFWQLGFTSGVDLTSATLYYKVNAPTFGTANDASWTQVTGTISAVPSSDNDRATFTLTGISPNTDIMFYIRAQTNTGGTRDGYAYPGQASWSTTAPSSQAETYKIRFNQASAYNTLRIDGQPHDWQATSQVAPRSTASATRTLDIMWDATYIYFLINDGFSASAGDRIHFGFDRNPSLGGNANGTTTNFSGASFPENYRPDIIFRARGTGLGTWTNDRATADGSNGWTYTGDIGNSATSDMWSVSGSNISLLEVRIARSAIGSFDSLGIFVWLSNSSDNLYDAFPHGNPSNNGLMPIQIGLPNLDDGTTPSTDRYFDGQYSHTSDFDIFGITTYRDLRISSPTGVVIGISNSLSGLTITRNLRVDANATLRPRAVQTITMTSAQGNIINNGFINASPAFANDLNFTIDGTITLSGSSPVDVFNLTVNAGDTLKVTGTNLRSGNTGTVTVNGTIEFGETNFLGQWSTLLNPNFALNSGATLITANERGVNGDNPSSFNGTIRVNGTVTYDNNATYIFSRDGNQTVGFTSQGSLPAISQANRIATLTRPTTRNVTMENNFVVTAVSSSPALNIGANTTLNIGTYTLTANGSLLGDGTISGTGTVAVNSTPAAIQIGGLTFNTNLSLQDSDGATMIGNASVTNSGSLTLGSNVKLTLQSGTQLTLNNATLTVSNPETEYIITQPNSSLKRTVGSGETKVFPIGTSATPFPLTTITTSGVTGGDVAVSVEAGNPATGRAGDGTFAIQAIYDISAPGFDFGTGDLSLNFGWLTSAEGSNFDRTKSFPARWTGSVWESYRTNASLTRDNASTIKRVQIGGLTVLAGEWAVFSGDDDSPLPVSLIAFTARATTRGIELVWRTATEQDNLGFILLRNGEELASYQTETRLRGNGTTLSESQYQFVDDAVEVGRTYTYRLRSVDFNGTIHDYDLSATATAIEKILSYQLLQNYPNPFNPTTVIEYQLPEPSAVKLELFDVLGRKVASLVDARQEAGSYRYRLQASSLSLASGVYLYRLTAGTFMSTKKMLFVK